MHIKKQACGRYETNCYIVCYDDKELIIDPGENALKFIENNVKNPIAIINTHGHYDHVYDNALVKEKYNIPIYIHKDDEFMLADPFNYGFTCSKADFLVENEEEIDIEGIKVKFHHFAGHTPGCCMVELVKEGVLFSGDFLFKRSIGRWDFPFSDAKLMRESLQKAMRMQGDFKLLPGHGEESTLKEERASLPAWLRYVV